MKVIADRVGINKATVYHHFDSKEEIYGKVLQKPLEEIASNFKTPSENLAPENQIRNQIHFVLEQLQEQPNLSKTLLREIINNGELLPESVQPLVEEVWSRFSDLLDQCETDKTTRELPNGIILRTLVGSLLTSVLETNFFPDIDQKDSEASVPAEQITEHLLAWIRE